MITALVSATCAMATLGAVLALITMEDWGFLSRGDTTIFVSPVDNMDDEQIDNTLQDEAVPDAAQVLPEPYQAELVVTVSPYADWSWYVEPPVRTVQNDPELADILRDSIDADTGTEFKRAVRKTPGAARRLASSNTTGTPSSASGNIPRQLARYKHTPLPPYPRSARLERREGVVILLINVSKDGLPQRVSVAESSGVPVLDEVSVAWVSKNWTFHPAVGDNGFVSCSIKAPIRFQLN